MNECKSWDIFGKNRLDATKRLLEGGGKCIENKNKHPFTGFKKCYTIITTKYLPWPFKKFDGEQGSEEENRRILELGALNTRVRTIELKITHGNK